MYSLAPVAFFAVKVGAYIAWCRLGVGWISGRFENRWAWSLGLAALRLGLGFVLGAAVLFGLGIFFPGQGGRTGFPPLFGSWVWTYALVFGFVRLMLWGFISAYLGRGIHAPVKKSAWALGGTALSFLTDVGGFVTATTLFGGFC